MTSEAKARGGRARAEVLSPLERQEISRKAATARWDKAKEIPKAEFTGEIRIGDIEIPCYVLEDGARVLSQRGVVGGLDMRYGSRAGGADRLTGFLVGKSISPFVSNELLALLSDPIMFRTPHGGKLAWGYPATVLADICEAVLSARQAGALQKQQEHIADRCEILIRGFARVGIIALVDEATGYQEVRDRQALQAILDQFLRKTLAAWAKRFPDEFYYHIARLRGWEWKGRKFNPPQIVAYYTNDFVYHRLAPNLIEELDKRNPIVHGRRRATHTQWLTEQVGHPALAQHLHAVIALMRASPTWDQFRSMIDIALPRHEGTLKLPMFQQNLEIERKEIQRSGEELPLFARLQSADSP